MLKLFVHAPCGQQDKPAHDDLTKIPKLHADAVYDSEGKPVTFAGLPDPEIDDGHNFGHPLELPSTNITQSQIPSIEQGKGLINIEPSVDILRPTFNKRVLTYFVRVPYNVTYAAIAPSYSNGYMVTVDGMPVSPGVMSDSKPLQVGNNEIKVIEVVIRSSINDISATRVYTVTFIRDGKYFLIDYWFALERVCMLISPPLFAHLSLSS